MPTRLQHHSLYLDVNIAQNKKNQHTFINKIAIGVNIV